MYSFTGGNDGRGPTAVVQGSDGSFYGTTEHGGTTNYDAVLGTYGNGTVFRISTNGVLTTLYSFAGGNDGGIWQNSGATVSGLSWCSFSWAGAAAAEDTELSWSNMI